jgi:hypothetical protein
VCVIGGGAFAMSGGEISGNTSIKSGGGVSVRNNGAFSMTGGTISGNIAESIGVNSNGGGGVYVHDSTFAMTGGEISGNSANQGGGVSMYANGTFTVSGNPVVSGNTNSVGVANNVYLGDEDTISVSNLTAGAVLGVTTGWTPIEGYPFTIATDAAADDSRYFFSDNSSCHVEQDGTTLLLVYGMPTGFRDPQGNEIVDDAVIGWLSDNNFTQADISALGGDAAATDKLYACYLLNCDFRVQGAGATIGFTGIAASNGVVSVTVQLVRKAPLGAINGVLNLYGADDLADGFGANPIADAAIDFGSDDPTFDTAATTDSVTQSATATFSVNYVTEKFFRAAIEAKASAEP